MPCPHLLQLLAWSCQGALVGGVGLVLQSGVEQHTLLSWAWHWQARTRTPGAWGPRGPRQGGQRLCMHACTGTAAHLSLVLSLLGGVLCGLQLLGGGVLGVGHALQAGSGQEGWD